MKVVARRCVIAVLHSLVMMTLTLPMASTALAAPRAVEGIIYVVAWGDSLSTIARRYGTTSSALAQANQVTNPDFIYVGQRLLIPGDSSAPPTGSGTYVVRRGDTLSAISVRFRTTVQQLVQMNVLSNPNLIHVGQRLAVPGGVSVDPPVDRDGTNTVYLVRRGDTLIGIATRFRVSMWDIVLANNIANPSLIYVGQSLVIPGGRGSGGSAPAPSPTTTSTPTPTPATATPRPPTATPKAPTPTPGPSYGFRYVPGSMRAFPNCGTVYFKGKIIGVGGEPVSGRTIRLRFAGNVAFKVSGEGDAPGEWGFAPLALHHYHSPFNFLIDVVENQANLVPQSDTLEIKFTDCQNAGQFENIVFQYSGTTPTPPGNATAVPTENPEPTSTPSNPLLPVDWDARLDQLSCVRLLTVAEQGVQLGPGDRYWRLVSARWLSEAESRRDIQIYVDLLDEAGQRVYGESVVFENGGSYRVISERQSCCYPWDYPVRWPMFNTLCSYSAQVDGLPSDVVSGMGLGTPEHPDWTVHTGFVLTFQRAVYQ